MLLLKRLVIPVFAILTVAGCDRIPGTDAARARDSLSRVLYDLDTAKISVRFSNKGHICGTVNAKNRMGAYAGNALFIVDKLDGDVTIFAEPPSLSDYREWRANLKEPLADEIGRKITDGCSFPKNWQDNCDKASGQSLPRNNEMCDAWSKSDIRTLSGMVDF